MGWLSELPETIFLGFARAGEVVAKSLTPGFPFVAALFVFVVLWFLIYAIRGLR